MEKIGSFTDVERAIQKQKKEKKNSTKAESIHQEGSAMKTNGVFNRVRLKYCVKF